MTLEVDVEVCVDVDGDADGDVGAGLAEVEMDTFCFSADRLATSKLCGDVKSCLSFCCALHLPAKTAESSGRPLSSTAPATGSKTPAPRPAEAGASVLSARLSSTNYPFSTQVRGGPVRIRDQNGCELYILLFSCLRYIRARMGMSRNGFEPDN